MEIIITIISLLLFVGVLVSPIILISLIYKSNNKFKFITYLAIGLIVIAINSLIFGWWTDESTIILLKHYDAYYINPDSNSYQVYYDKVLTENMDRVKKLERSHMGVGWPLRSIVLFFFSLFYYLLLYVVIE
jgi:hypothetical protein